MNKEKYLSELMQRSKYCECPNFADLFEKRKTAQSLEARCDFFKRETDLENPMPQDERFLKDYQRRTNELKRAVTEYHQALYQNALDFRVYFELHEPEKSDNPRKISFEEVEPLFNKNSQIISIHCSSCDQQIDVLALSSSS